MARTKHTQRLKLSPRTVEQMKRNSTRGTSIIFLDDVFKTGHLLFGLSAPRKPYLKRLGESAGRDYVVAHQLNLNNGLVDDFIVGKFDGKGSEDALKDGAQQCHVRRLRRHKRASCNIN